MSNQVSMKDVANQAKQSMIATMGVVPQLVGTASRAIGSVDDVVATLANQTKRLRTDSDAMQQLHNMKPKLIAAKDFRKVGKLMTAITLLESVLDGEELTEAEYVELDDIQKLLGL